MVGDMMMRSLSDMDPASMAAATIALVIPTSGGSRPVTRFQLGFSFVMSSQISFSDMPSQVSFSNSSPMAMVRRPSFDCACFQPSTSKNLDEFGL